MNLDLLRAFDFKSILDIGANVGNWTTQAMQIWPRASFFMIEANPECEGFLHSLCTTAENCSLGIALLGESRREGVPFYTAGDCATGDSVYKELSDVYDGCKVVNLSQFTLKAICQHDFRHDKFDLIKIDTQGSEVDIIKGGLEIVQNARCVILEVSDKPYNEGAPLAPEVIEYMGSIGFPEYVEIGSNAVNQRDLAFVKTKEDAELIPSPKPNGRFAQGKLDVLIALYAYGGNGGIAMILPKIAIWLAKLNKEMSADERIGRIGVKTLGDVPLTMCRNSCVRQAIEGGFDAILMIDSDNIPDLYLGHDPNAKPFWQTSFDFLYERSQRGIPTVVCAPYCGPPPHPVDGGQENVYVFYFATDESDVPLASFSLEAYTRDHAALMRGIQPIGAGPTGCILYSTDAFDLMPINEMTDSEILDKVAKGELPPDRAKTLLRMESYYWYEFTDGYQTRKASTEDVTNTREINLAGIQKHGEPIVFCNWDAWAGHVKPKVVGKPQPIVAEQVSELLAEAIRNDVHAGDQIVEVDFTSANEPWVAERRVENRKAVEETFDLPETKGSAVFAVTAATSQEPLEVFSHLQQTPVVRQMRLGEAFVNPTASLGDCTVIRSAMTCDKAMRILVIGDKSGELCWSAKHSDDASVYALGTDESLLPKGNVANSIKLLPNEPRVNGSPGNGSHANGKTSWSDLSENYKPQELDAIVSDVSGVKAASAWFGRHLKAGGKLFMVGADRLNAIGDAWRFVEGSTVAIARKAENVRT